MPAALILDMNCCQLSLAWTDPAGSLLASEKLVNNLDLSIQSPSSDHEIWGNNDHLPIQSQQPDKINNFEEIFLENPTPGVYNVYISASRLVFSPQAYALVVTMGANGQSATSTFYPEPKTVDAADCSLSDANVVKNNKNAKTKKTKQTACLRHVYIWQMCPFFRKFCIFYSMRYMYMYIAPHSYSYGYGYGYGGLFKFFKICIIYFCFLEYIFSSDCSG